MKTFLLLTLMVFSPFYCLIAQEKPDDTLRKEQENKWRFELTSYFWAASIYNNITIGPVSLERDHRFKKIFANLYYAIPIHFECGKNRWTLIAGFLYSKDDVIQLAQYTFWDKLPVISTVEIKTEYTVTKIQWEVLEAYLVTPEKSRGKVDVILGIRYTRQVNNFELAGESILDTLDFFPLSINATYLDPLIGARYKNQFHKNWRFYFMADIEGFSVGSKFTSNMIARISYRAASFIDVELGCRWLYVNYDNDKSGIKHYINKSHEIGPVISVMFKW